MMWYTYPFMLGCTCSQITTPLVYSEDMSIAQQIAHLFGLFQQQADTYVSQSDFNAFLEWLSGELEARSEIANQYTDASIASLRGELTNLIVDLQGGQLIWNVQLGRFTASPDAMTDMFNDLTIYSLYVSELADSEQVPTVESLADIGLTVRGLAVYSGRFLNVDYLPTDLFTESE